MDWGGGALMDSRVACHAGGRPVAPSPLPLSYRKAYGDGDIFISPLKRFTSN